MGNADRFQHIGDRNIPAPAPEQALHQSDRDQLSVAFEALLDKKPLLIPADDPGP
ncbi:MAG: hypothetical protein MPW15_25940 [Candidatus Manganitrophus sp.]|nr:hypothetical protein [Candidatus Manganitrophus sp.]